MTGAPSRAASPAVAPPPGNPRFPLFDSLRGLAVLAVVVFHVFIVTGALNRRGIGDAVAVLGSQGPILFFAISGFLLYRPWVAARAAGAPTPRLARYARRRALRILPALLVRADSARGLSRDRRRLHRRLVALLLLPAALRPRHARAWHPRRVDALRRGDVLPRIAVVGARAAARAARRRVSGPGSAPSWPGSRCWPARGALVQVAAARQEVSHLAAQSLLGQSTWFALGMALAVASVAEPHPERRGRRSAPRSSVPGSAGPARRWHSPRSCCCAGSAGGLFGILRALRDRAALREDLRGYRADGDDADADPAAGHVRRRAAAGCPGACWQPRRSRCSA